MGVLAGRPEAEIVGALEDREVVESVALEFHRHAEAAEAGTDNHY